MTDFEKNYTRLSYIESTGTQYIDTGIVLNQNSSVIVDAEYTSTTGVQMLFCYNVAGNSAGKAQAKIYSAQIYDGSTMVRNFIPVERKSDGAVGLYDLVSEQFFGNAGTGSFGGGDLQGNAIIDLTYQSGQDGWYAGRWVQRIFPFDNSESALFQYGTQVLATVRFEDLSTLGSIDINDMDLTEGEDYTINGNEITIAYTIGKTGYNLIGSDSFIDFIFADTTEHIATIEKFIILNPPRQDFSDCEKSELTDFTIRINQKGGYENSSFAVGKRMFL